VGRERLPCLGHALDLHPGRMTVNVPSAGRTRTHTATRIWSARTTGADTPGATTPGA
jgi:hypothetical protein